MGPPNPFLSNVESSFLSLIPADGAVVVVVDGAGEVVGVDEAIAVVFFVVVATVVEAEV